MNALDILTKAREIVSAGWCQGRYSLDSKSYCAMGAIYAAEARIEDSLPVKFLTITNHLRVIKFLSNAVTGRYDANGKDVINFNDSHTKDEVLKAFDVAISNCKRRKFTRVPLRTAR